MRKSKFFDPLAMSVAAGHTIKASSAIVGCAESTAYNLSATSEFRKRVNEIRSEAVAAAVGKLSDAAAQAVATLTELLEASNDPKDRLAAAKAILAALPTISEFGELRERVDALESQPPHLKVAQ